MAPSLGLDPLVIALVLLAALLHASWNAVLKVASDRVTTSAVMNLTGLAVGSVLALFFTAPESPSWIFILLSVAIHFAYFLFLLGSYRYGDLSQVYPLARGVAPLIVAFLSPWLIGEHLGSVQLAGVTLLCLGILSLAFNRLRVRDLVEWKPVAMALATGGSIAAYTIVDGLGVRVSGSPGGYIAWLFLLDGISMAAVAVWLRGRAFGAAVRSTWKPAVLGGHRHRRDQSAGAVILGPMSTRRRKNILLVTFDQWRADCLSAVGHPCLKTPHLDAFAADGVLFRRHYTQA